MSGADPTTLLFRDFLEAQERTALTPVEILRMAGMEPDPWQTEVLDYQGDRMLLNCSRQIGEEHDSGGAGGWYADLEAGGAGTDDGAEPTTERRAV